MDHFTRSTIIQSEARIRRQRLLPRGGDIVVAIGQEVSPLQVLARSPLSMLFRIVFAAKNLNVPVEEFNNYLAVKEGDKVEAGTVLAQKKRLLGQQTLESPIDGEVTQIYNGRIILKQTADFIELRAMVQGRIVNYIDDRGVTLEVIGTQIQAMWSTGTVALSPMKIMGDTPNKIFSSSDITGNISNHILVIGQLDSVEPIQAAITEGVKGFIIGTMPAHLVDACRALDTTILLTDGFGEHGMAETIFTKLQELSGQETTIFSRDGLNNRQRAEIIIPKSGTPSLTDPPYNKPIQVGQAVRILRQPYLGNIGVIEHIYNQFHSTPSGVRVRGADVRLQNGQKVFIPTSNLDAII
ncbi:MAG: hypothetical protein AAF490_03610 [Chloroflexota bacterium]